jgi:hypothetical protein
MTPGRAAIITFLVIWLGGSPGGIVLGLQPGLPGGVGLVAGLVTAAVVYRLRGGRPIGPGPD